MCAQNTALVSSESLIRQSRKCLKETRRRTLLPCQIGMLRCITSLRGLYAALSSTQGDFKYIMTSHLNQDCVENLFSQVRGMSGANQMPDAADFTARLRMLLMAPAPLVAARCSVQLEGDAEFVTTGQLSESTSPGNLSSEALEGMVIPVRPCSPFVVLYFHFNVNCERANRSLLGTNSV